MPPTGKRARAAGHIGDRLAGLVDILPLVDGCTVLDIAANRGLIAFEFARYGASLVHGCDRYSAGITTAREIFNEVQTESRFEVMDLGGGAAALQEAFGSDYREQYDIVLFLGIFQHLERQMQPEPLAALVHHLAQRTKRYFAYRTTRHAELEDILSKTGLTKVHFSHLSLVTGPAGIWERRASGG